MWRRQRSVFEGSMRASRRRLGCGSGVGAGTHEKRVKRAATRDHQHAQCRRGQDRDDCGGSNRDRRLFAVHAQLQLPVDHRAGDECEGAAPPELRTRSTRSGMWGGFCSSTQAPGHASPRHVPKWQNGRLNAKGGQQSNLKRTSLARLKSKTRKQQPGSVCQP